MIEDFLKRGNKMNYDFLKTAKGIIHIGASKGNERKIYKHYPNLNVLFVEALPDVYEILKAKTQGNPKWKSLNYCVTDKDDTMTKFYRSSNRGLSSSIYEFFGHKEIWKHISMVETLEIPTITLPTMLQREKIDVSNFDVLLMDTQGSEILVLNGAEQIINNFEYIISEAATFEAYKGCGMLADIEKFMDNNDFELVWKELQVAKEGLGEYYDVCYKRNYKCHANSTEE